MRSLGLTVVVMMLGCEDSPKPDPEAEAQKRDASELGAMCRSFIGSTRDAARNWIPHAQDNDACPPGAAENGKPGCSVINMRDTRKQTQAETFVIGATVHACRNDLLDMDKPLRDTVGRMLASSGYDMPPAKFYTLAACAVIHAPRYQGIGTDLCTELRVKLAKEIGHDAWRWNFGKPCWSPADCLLFDEPPACCKAYPVTAEELGFGSVGARAPMPPPPKPTP